jgi:hypothetical protein
MEQALPMLMTHPLSSLCPLVGKICFLSFTSWCFGMSHFIRLRLSDAFASLSLIFWPLPQTQINGSNGIMSSIEGSKFEKNSSTC